MKRSAERDTISIMDETLTGSESPVAATDDQTAFAGTSTLVEPKQAPRTSDPQSLAPSIEALLLSVDRPIPAQRLAEVLGLAPDPDEPRASAALLAAPPQPVEPEGADQPAKKKPKKVKPPTPAAIIQSAIDLLNSQYEQSARSFRIQSVAGGYRVMTLPQFGPILEEFHGKRERHGVSRAALESLAIIAYKQPITRAGLEAIRGVACGEVLRSLIERRLITITGRAEELGRPMLYGTTKAFLETFGLATIKDLPTAADLRFGGENSANEEPE
jgi:segregation and condensation protein B